MQIVINVIEKKAIAAKDYIIVCGNSDYKVKFVFDSEWDGREIKTVRFGFNQNGEKKHIDVIMDGNECDMPILSNVNTVEIGAYAGDLQTTTPCLLYCEKSILCDGGTPEEPAEDIYNQIIDKCNEAVKTAQDVETRANNGEFNGKDYVLTDTDKKEISSLVGGGEQWEIIVDETLNEKIDYIDYSFDRPLKKLVVQLTGNGIKTTASTSYVCLNGEIDTDSGSTLSIDGTHSMDCKSSVTKQATMLFNCENGLTEAKYFCNMYYESVELLQHTIEPTHTAYGIAPYNNIYRFVMGFTSNIASGLHILIKGVAINE